MSVKIYLEENEPIEKALRRFRKKLSEDGVLRQYKLKQRYEKPSDKRRRKQKEALRKLKKKQRRY